MVRSSRFSPARRLAATLGVLLLAGGSPAAQEGFRTDEFKELGLTLRRPKSYEQIPLQPDEPWRVLFYAEKEKQARTKKQEEEQRKNRFGVAKLEVVWIDWAPDPEPAEGTLPAGERRTSSSPGKDDGPPPAITTIDRYLAQKMGHWRVVEWQEGKDVDGHEGRYADLARVGNGAGGERGFVYALQNDAHTLAFIGVAHESEFEDQRSLWRTVAERVSIGEPEKPDPGKWIRYYESKRFRGADYRVRVRTGLVRGWEVEDLEDYIVVYHTSDQPLLRQIYRNLEAIREEYLRLFPPSKPIEAVSTVRICRDRDEYLRYGGMSGSAGYWNFRTEELVLYDAAIIEKGERPKDDDTFIVLYHEAFHQYIYYSSGSVSPHSWFNEGYGDYFSGAEVKGGKVLRIGVNPWRIRTIKRAVEERGEAAWKDIIRFAQRQYYANPGLYYAQGWSMIYFLNHAPAVQREASWARILPTYFETIQRVNAEKLAELVEQGLAEEPAYVYAAQEEAREAAVTAAFEGIDLLALHHAWREYIGSIEWSE